MTSKSFLVSCIFDPRFCNPPEVKFDVFGISKHREARKIIIEFFFLAILISFTWRFYRVNKKKSVISTSGQCARLQVKLSGFERCWRRCVVLFGKTLYCQCISMGTSKRNLKLPNWPWVIEKVCLELTHSRFKEQNQLLDFEITRAITP